MICAGSGRHAPQAIAGTAHKRPIGYCPHCARAHALTNANRIWKHQDLDGPQTTLDDVPESETAMTRRDPPEGLVFTGLPEPDEPQLPDDLCQFCYELADEMAVHNQSDVMTEYTEIHHHAHGPSPDDWADQVDEQRKRADAAEADLAAVDQALAELRDQISRQ